MSDLRLLYDNLGFTISSNEMLSQNCDYRYTVFYQKNILSELSALCDKYGSDKGEIVTTGHPYNWPSHTYADFYEELFGHCRGCLKNVFECGLGTNNPHVPSNMGISGKPGASLRVWRDYFPNARIYGADIDAKTLFQEERIATFHLDQTSPESIARVWKTVDADEFDLMIDDGLHTFEAGICLFENSFFKLRTSGIYVIEDVQVDSMLKFVSYFRKNNCNVKFVNLHRPNRPLADNSLVVVRK
jgi:hypothetical protein